MKTTKILSIDAETNGLWGQPFSIAAIAMEMNENGEIVEVDKICLRMPDSVITSDFVIEKVIPTLNFPVTHTDYLEMLKEFAAFYMKYKGEYAPLWHIGHIVEAHLFRELVVNNLIGEWDAPYTPIEVGDHLRLKDFDPASVDNYATEMDLEIKDYGCTHNPLYDCEVAGKVYFSLNFCVVK